MTAELWEVLGPHRSAVLVVLRRIGEHEGVPSYEKTCRDEILEAMRALERRHGRDSFSPAEILAEVRARGDEHADSTVRTHIVSAMCVNAPPNHAVRYPDLERVGPGLYRRTSHD